MQVLAGFDGDTPRLRPPASQATVKQGEWMSAGEILSQSPDWLALATSGGTGCC